ncbi:MAG: LytTR family DNA-binding domain-containing protein [Eubacteriales bacterium]|nr:LytTR family DNA-binding domain-containing protein [Eubacteriales bacterium]
MPIELAIVDDCKEDREGFRKQIELALKDQTSSLKVATTCFDSGVALLERLSVQRFSVIFLDVCMNEMNGIQTAQKIREQDMGCLIIFLTYSGEYAWDAFPVHPFDYLLKPCAQKEVERVLAQIFKALKASEPELEVKCSRCMVRVLYRDIIYVAAEGHFVEMELRSGNRLRSSTPFAAFIEPLCLDERFLSCNRGVLINMDEVLTLTDGVFSMNGGEKFPLRQRGRSELTNRFIQYQFHRIRQGG